MNTAVDLGAGESALDEGVDELIEGSVGHWQRIGWDGNGEDEPGCGGLRRSLASVMQKTPSIADDIRATREAGGDGLGGAFVGLSDPCGVDTEGSSAAARMAETAATVRRSTPAARSSVAL
jgi:hypothetical protein